MGLTALHRPRPSLSNWCHRPYRIERAEQWMGDPAWWVYGLLREACLGHALDVIAWELPVCFADNTSHNKPRRCRHASGEKAAHNQSGMQALSDCTWPWRHRRISIWSQLDVLIFGISVKSTAVGYDIKLRGLRAVSWLQDRHAEILAIHLYLQEFHREAVVVVGTIVTCGSRADSPLKGVNTWHEPIRI